MKKIILLITLFTTHVSVSKDYLNEIIGFFDSQIEKSQTLRHENALISSHSDLQFYSTLKNESFPLNYLNSFEKELFINSLTFNKNGLTSYNYKSLENLSEKEIYEVLSLFGYENHLELINKPEASKCGVGVLIKCADHVGYKCESRATCKAANGFICMSNC